MSGAWTPPTPTPGGYHQHVGIGPDQDPHLRLPAGRRHQAEISGGGPPPDSAAPKGLTGGVNLLWAADDDDEKACAYLVPNQSPEFDQETV